MAKFSLQDFFDSPNYYLIEFSDPNALVVHMDRDAYQRSVFCDSRISTASNNRIQLPYQPLIEYCETEVRGIPDISYIFHMAHCGSTLLARAIDVKDQNIVCREPSALRQLGVEAASTFFGGDIPDLWQSKLNLLTTLLGRSYKKDGPVIVKANVPVNFVIPQLMGTNPKSRSMVLYFGLESYLLAILKSESHRKWVTIVGKELGRGLAATIGLDDEELSKLSCPQTAACLWLAQIVIFHEMLKTHPHTRSLDADYFFSDPATVLSEQFKFIGQAIASERVNEIAKSEIFCRYSKDPSRRFDNTMRLKQREELKLRLAADLFEARSWVERHSDKVRIPDRLPQPLAGESPVLLS